MEILGEDHPTTLGPDLATNADEATRPRPAPAPVRDDKFRKARCVYYPDQAATRRCEVCDNYLSDAVIVKRYINHEKVEICPCPSGARVLRLSAEERGLKPHTFQSTLGGAFLYPFGGAGPVMLVFGSLFFAAMALLGHIPYIGVGFAIITAVYLTAYLVKIVFATAMGEDEPPSWPELGRPWQNLFAPTLFVAFVGALCFGPAVGYYYAVGSDPICWMLALIGGFFFPMGLATVSVMPNAASLNPLFWLNAICAVPADYMMASVTFFVAFGLKILGEQTFGQIPYVGVALGTALAFFFLMVEMRILGLILHENKKEIGWL